MSSRPANFVLWYDIWGEYHVTPRVGVKREWALKDHFVEFFSREEDAWNLAEERTKARMRDLRKRLARYQREARIAKRKSRKRASGAGPARR